MAAVALMATAADSDHWLNLSLHWNGFILRESQLFRKQEYVAATFFGDSRFSGDIFRCWRLTTHRSAKHVPEQLLNGSVVRAPLVGLDLILARQRSTVCAPIRGHLCEPLLHFT